MIMTQYDLYPPSLQPLKYIETKQERTLQHILMRDGLAPLPAPAWGEVEGENIYIHRTTKEMIYERHWESNVSLNEYVKQFTQK